MTRTRRLTGAVVVASATVLLAGCSTHPGSAAVVGSQAISDHRLADVSEALCTAQRSVQAAQGGQAQPISAGSARRQALGLLVDSELNKQYARAEHISTSQAQLSAAMKGYDQLLGTIPRKDRAPLRSTLLAYTRSQLVDLAVGRAALQQQGTANPQPQQAVSAGAQVRAAWVSKHVKVSVNPRYGSFSKGTLASSSGGSLSAPVSAQAVSAAKATPAASDVAGLPTNQTCG